MQYNFIVDFHKSRKNKIGASDVPKLIPSPNRPIESLSAFTDSNGKRKHETALDLYYEKINGKDFKYSFPAEMGHRMEGFALYEFIADNISRDIAIEFLRGYQLHKIETTFKKDAVTPEPFNTTPFKHNTEVNNDFGVAHGDCLYDPSDGIVVPEEFRMKKETQKEFKGHITHKKNGLTIDLSKPFLIEAKSARSHTVSARKHDQYKGYDLKLKEWQGIPLKVYFQVQYQMLLYNVDVCYIALIFDTSEKYYWQVKANENHQKDLIQLATYMKKCIDEKTPPKELLMNSKDIAKLYPEIKDDFREVKDDELQELLKIAVDRKYAAKQETIWKHKKEDADERMSIHLKDTAMLKGKVNDSLVDIAKWKNTGGAERVMGLSDIGKREDSNLIMNFLKSRNLIKKDKENKKSQIAISSKELEGVIFEDGKDE